jgi:hypothetical protein
LRLFAPLPKHRLTEAGTPVTVRIESECDDLKTIWMQGEGYAGYAGVMSVLCLRSLTLLISEEICGRFGRFDDLAGAYRLVRVIVERRLSDDASDSFTVLRLLLLW